MDAAAIRRIRSAVLKWYEGHGRKLPWRESADPYRIWLSEVMLQQTTVVAVVPYFERFTARFPDLQSLASASIDEVLRLWEGLGYYSRARNLHKAAQVIVDQHAGCFPADVTALRTLPGIGRYTAGAIASFAFDQPAAIVEANTERLYARLIALPDDVRTSRSQKSLWEFAEKLIPRKRPGDFNQSLMDIGSKICKPQDPDCDHCPLAGSCETFRNGLQKQIPVRKLRTAVTAINEIAVALVCRNRYLLRRRSSTERWAGMWDFVRFEIDASEACELPRTMPLRLPREKSKSKNTDRPDASIGGEKSSPRQKAAKSLLSATGKSQPSLLSLPDSLDARIIEQSEIAAGSVISSMEFGYSVTRFRVRLFCFLCQAEKPPRTRHTTDEKQWFSASELEGLPLSATGRQIAKWILVSQHSP